MKRKKDEEGSTPAVPRMLKKSSRITVFQAVRSETRFNQIGGNQKSLAVITPIFFYFFILNQNLRNPNIYLYFLFFIFFIFHISNSIFRLILQIISYYLNFKLFRISFLNL